MVILIIGKKPRRYFNNQIKIIKYKKL